jgi:hypothetical protein
MYNFYYLKFGEFVPKEKIKKKKPSPSFSKKNKNFLKLFQFFFPTESPKFVGKKKHGPVVL